MTTSRVIVGDCRTVLRTLPEASCHMCVTSPPYWQQRDYGVTGQLGQEKTLLEYTASLVEVFRGVRRVLRDDGLVFLNIGDQCETVQQARIPATCVEALQEDGWLVVREVVWHKTDANLDTSERRPRMDYEMIYLLAKSRSWYYDLHALPSRYNRSVWSIATANYKDAHFAVFPEELVRRCVLFGTSDRGCCPKCLAPWKRVVEKKSVATRPALNNVNDPTGMANRDPGRHVTEVRTTGWEPGCECYERYRTSGLTRNYPHDPSEWAREACTVFDPFCGSGTTGAVARKLGRDFIGLELSEEYAAMARKRIANPHPKPEVPDVEGQTKLWGDE